MKPTVWPLFCTLCQETRLHKGLACTKCNKLHEIALKGDTDKLLQRPKQKGKT